ncbi:MAG: CPBP family intramembrane metalloprotease [Proteobacteria bacterium]|nr:CPBP family intramembrane metalloprotease [Pseudomonadota bacterium]
MINKTLPLQVIGCFAIALLSLLACFFLLGMRNDGERIAFPEKQEPSQDMAQVSFDSPVNGRVAVFVCAPEPNKPDLEALSEINIQTMDDDGILYDVDRLTLTSPMPLDIPPDFAQKNALPERVVCNDSDIINLEEVYPELDEVDPESDLPLLSGPSITRKMTIPGKAFVVAAVSDPGLLIFEKSLFFAFLFALWAGIAMLSRKYRLSACRFKRYDFLLAFGGGNLFALLLLEAISYLPFEKNSLLPGYGEMLAMLFVNFVGFLATAAFFIWLRHPKNTPWLQTIDSNLSEIPPTPNDQIPDDPNDTQTVAAPPDQRPHWVPVKLRYPFLLGIGLAVVGSAVVLLLVEQPGLTTFTMASQLISTLFLTGIFAILAAISEESVFRGIIQSSLEAKPNSQNPRLMNVIAIAVATALFVGMHVAQSIDHLWALIPIAAVSVTSGILKIQYRTIFPCILLHMTYNATLVVLGILIA